MEPEIENEIRERVTRIELPSGSIDENFYNEIIEHYLSLQAQSDRPEGVTLVLSTGTEINFKELQEIKDILGLSQCPPLIEERPRYGRQRQRYKDHLPSKGFYSYSLFTTGA